MLKNEGLKQLFRYTELLAVILSISLLPIDRFPYIHHIPLRLGAISFILLLAVAAIRFFKIVYEQRWPDLKRVLIVGFLLLLPVVGYAQSIHYALDRILAVGATKLLLIAALKGVCFFILLYENRALWPAVKNTIYAITALIVAFGFFQFVFDIFGASTKITDLRSCCTSNSTYIFPRVHSVAIEPLYFANFLILPIWLMIYDLVFDKSTRKNKLLLLLLVATASLFVLSLARSAILAMLVTGVIFVFGFGDNKFKKYLPNIGKVISAILIIAIAFVALSGVASKFINKSAIHGSKSGIKGNVELFSGHVVAVNDESAQTRYSLWPKAFTYIKEKPWQGVGAYNSRVRLNLADYQKGKPDYQLQPFNNDLLGLLVDLGLIGVIAFGPLVVAIIVAAIRLIRLRWKSRSAPFVLAAIAMMIQSNFFHEILLARLWVVGGIALTGLYINHKTVKSLNNSGL